MFSQLATFFRALFLGALCVSPMLLQAQQIQSREVVLRLKWFHQFQFAGYYAAQKMGYYREAGMRVTILPRDINSSPVAEVLAGSAHFGISDSSLALHKLNGEPVVVLACIFQNSPMVLISLAEQQMVSPLDFVGKRIMYQKGVNDAMIAALFYEVGLKPGDYQYLPHSFDDMALIKGDTDVISAYITDQPFLYKQKGIEVNIANPINYGIDFYGDLLFTSQSLLKRDPELVLAFRKASIRGWQYALENPQQVIDWLITDYHSQKSRAALTYEAQATRRVIRPLLTELGNINMGRFTQISKIYQEKGLAPESGDLSGFHYLDYFKQAPRETFYLRTAIFFVVLTLLVVATVLNLNRGLKKSVAQSSEELYRANQQLQETIYNAEAANRSKSAFLANMSHEIRTPLNAIINMSKLCLQTQVNAKQHNYLTKVHSSANFLLQIINDILDFSKIEAGKLDLESKSFAIDGLLSQLAMLAGPKARDKQIQLLFDLQPPLPLYYTGDMLRLGQILLNLVSNGIKFTSQGYVSVTFKAVSGKQDMVTLAITVQDTGIGISKAAQKNLFHSFSQADVSITRRFGGSGLGLVICKELASLMGGELLLSSEENVGTSVTVNIPMALAPAPALPQQCWVPQVLLIGTDKKTITSMANTLAVFDIPVSCANSVHGLADKLQDIELILIDNSFDPVLTPAAVIDFIERLGQRCDYLATGDKKIPVYLLTSGQAMPEQLASYTGYYLKKPIYYSRLYRAVCGEHDPVDKPQATPQPVSPAWQGKQVLLAEDNDINREIVMELLADSGIKLTAVADGKAAIAALEQHAYDLVLMDIQMPVMDGVTATKIIRKNPDWQQLPIIALTASAMVGDREVGLSIGMSDYLTKPLDAQDFYAVLAKWLGPNHDKQKHQQQNTRESETVLTINQRQVQGIDLQAGLRSCLGKRPLLEKLVVQFAKKFCHISPELKGAIKNHDYDKAKAISHNLKGVAGNIGALTISRLAADIDKGLAQQPVEIAEDALVQLEQELQRLLASLGSLG
ncbi:ABC transporter substrate-binding protein [Thalassomonas sp. RHCl1]|uniref:ABC transporter substrate-binding protein n=1 Tax=Thalassomonas sp. RHCl1 TaxID=2995320 RepID=UPI00248D04C6|nr:ABC transporter substrate-binding protein [Thalassomonas sp. RHCl1]